MSSVLGHVPGAGGAKLAGAKPIVEQFEEFGLPKAMLYLVGGLEVAAAIGVHVSALAYAAAGSVLLMIGAIANYVKVKHAFGQSVPALLVLSLAAAIAYQTLPFG